MFSFPPQTRNTSKQLARDSPPPLRSSSNQKYANTVATVSYFDEICIISNLSRGGFAWEPLRTVEEDAARRRGGQLDGWSGLGSVRSLEARRRVLLGPGAERNDLILRGCSGTVRLCIAFSTLFELTPTHASSFRRSIPGWGDIIKWPRIC